MLKLIVEDDLDLCSATIVESTEEEKKEDRYHPLLLRGKFIQCEVLNKNKRKYHFDAMKKEVDRFIKEEINNSVAFGNFEHPKNSEINREDGAIKINKLECDEKNKCWYGESQVMYTDLRHSHTGSPKGDLLKSYLDVGCKMGHSTRGCGEIISPYVENYTLITIDATITPSVGESAWCDGILESKEFMIDVHGKLVECALNNFEKSIDSSTKTFDLDKKREIYKAAWDTLLKKI